MSQLYLHYPHFFKTTFPILFVFLLGSTSLSAQADLTIRGALEPNDRQAESGERVTVDYSLTNIGNVDADELDVGIYFSDDQLLSDNDRLLARDNIGNVEVGETESENEQFALPSGIVDGVYYIILKADDLDIIAEQDKTNNTVAIEINIGDAGNLNLADLSFSTARIDIIGQTAESGERITVEYGITNSGNTDAENFDVGIYFSNDQTLSADDELLARDNLANIEAVETEDEEEEFALPSGLAGGIYYIILKADDLDVIQEQDKTNNTVALEITIGTGTDSGGGSSGNGSTGNTQDADLFFSTAALEPGDENAGPGDRITIEYSLTNSGNTDAEEFDVGIYLSTDEVLSTDDRLLARDNIVNVEVGETEDENEQVTIPADMEDGDYFIILKVDDLDVVVESEKSNNEITLNKNIARSTLSIDDSTLTKNLSLSNYPNPVRKQTTFQYHIVQTANVELKIVNIAGQVVESLVNERQNAGEHNLPYKNKLPSGMYIYILEVDGNQNTGKMIVE